MEMRDLQLWEAIERYFVMIKKRRGTVKRWRRSFRENSTGSISMWWTNIAKTHVGIEYKDVDTDTNVMALGEKTTDGGDGATAAARDFNPTRVEATKISLSLIFNIGFNYDSLTRHNIFFMCNNPVTCYVKNNGEGINYPLNGSYEKDIDIVWISRTSVAVERIDCAVSYQTQNGIYLIENEQSIPGLYYLRQIKSLHVGCKGHRNEDLQWRYSFNEAEKRLVHSFNTTQAKCYALNSLSSYARLDVQIQDIIYRSLNYEVEKGNLLERRAVMAVQMSPRRDVIFMKNEIYAVPGNAKVEMFMVGHVPDPLNPLSRCRQCLVVDPNLYTTYLEEADKAISTMEIICSVSPNSHLPASLNLLGDCYLKREKVNKAMEKVFPFNAEEQYEKRCTLTCGQACVEKTIGKMVKES
ncbi:hypothetical protein CHS0354_016362 [Potamilus streckersoni]|uniref:Uncharacterized protein n=1 Tax=Potamilus streckersoni TaxID=2493646 RepID=A0AAE0SWN0_9BIVA|nr:hypothetical protein CHS0354_016362 [Potamilus streckersoni]